MCPLASPRNRIRTWKDPFVLAGKHTDVQQEVLAGVLGWMTVVSSVAFYAKLFVGDDEDVNQDATAEMFMLVAGASSMVFGVAFNVPFIVAPSVLYAPREAGIDMGEHLADQFVSNLAAAAFFALALKLSFVSFVPTALRLGAGCGISILVSVLGLRSLGLLVADSFTLQPFTWQSVVGLAVITASCAEVSNLASPAENMRKWKIIIGAPMALTVLVYAVVDRSKFQGFSSAESAPLSNVGRGSFGIAEFGGLWDDFSPLQWFYVGRTFLSITINISSILLVLIDAVCLEELHNKVKASGEVDFSNAIGGTKKFRFMACSIPLMSSIGNLAGVTTQAAFVQSMILVFVGGRTGLSTVVTGSMFVLSAVLWPLLPVLVPGHVSGALAVVISLRFFTVIRMVDVTRPQNLLMFGLSMLLIPFSFDFVDALCISTVLGFLCENGNKRLWSTSITNKGAISALRRFGSSSTTNKVAVSATEEEDQYVNASSLACETQRGFKATTRDTDRERGVEDGSEIHPESHPVPTRRNERLKPLSPELPFGERKHMTADATPPRRANQLPPLKKILSQGLNSPSLKQTSRQEETEAAALTKSPRGDRAAVHWGLAFVAAFELALSVIRDRVLDGSADSE